MARTPARQRFANVELTPEQEAKLQESQKQFWDDVARYWAGQTSRIKEVDGQLRQMPEPD